MKVFHTIATNQLIRSLFRAFSSEKITYNAYILVALFEALECCPVVTGEAYTDAKGCVYLGRNELLFWKGETRESLPSIQFDRSLIVRLNGFRIKLGPITTIRRLFLIRFN